MHWLHLVGGGYGQSPLPLSGSRTHFTICPYNNQILFTITPRSKFWSNFHEIVTYQWLKETMLFMTYDNLYSVLFDYQYSLFIVKITNLVNNGPVLLNWAKTKLILQLILTYIQDKINKKCKTQKSLCPCRLKASPIATVMSRPKIISSLH